MEKNTSLSRELGNFERSFLKLSATSVLVSHVSGHVFNAQIVDEAWRIMCKTIPNLRMRIEFSHNSTVNIVEAKHVKEVLLINTDQEHKWKEILFDEMNKRFNYEDDSNLVKLILIQNGQVSQVFLIGDHVLFDGSSVAILIRTFLQTYVKLINHESVELETFELVSNVEKYIFPNESNESNLSTNNEIISPLDYKIYNNTVNYFLNIDGSQENFRKIKEISKIKGITIGSIIFASTYFNLAKFSNHEKGITYSYDVDLRKRYDFRVKPEKAVGLLIGILPSPRIFIKNETDFWDLCGFISNFLKKISKSDIESTFKSASSSSSSEPPILNLSNIGTYPFETVYDLCNGDKITLEKLNGSGSWCPAFGKFVLIIFTISYINYNFTYYDTGDIKLFESIANLVERCHEYEKLSFEEYMKI